MNPPDKPKQKRHYKSYESDRIHSHQPIKCTSGRRCSYCHGPIDWIPSDVDPRYARFCISCRYQKIPNDIDTSWMGGV